VTDDAPVAAALQVVKGSPDDAELAALVAGMVAAAAGGGEHNGAPSSAWMDRSRGLRGRRGFGLPARGEAAWRFSLRA